MARQQEYRTALARALRRRQTPPEGVLWSRLKAKRLAGLKFRRQHPIGSYVVDFCCPHAMLVVEVDSSYHAGRQAEDAARDQGLEERGYAVLRITAGDVATNLDGVLGTLLRVAHERIAALEEREKR